MKKIVLKRFVDLDRGSSRDSYSFEGLRFCLATAVYAASVLPEVRT